MGDFSVQPLIDALRDASEALRTEVGQLAEAAAQRTADRVVQASPQGPTGTLRARVTVGPPRGWTRSEGALAPARVVRSSAPHVHFVEGGRDGFGRAGRKRVPARPIFVATAVTERQAFLQEALALLTRDRELI